MRERERRRSGVIVKRARNKDRIGRGERVKVDLIELEAVERLGALLSLAGCSPGPRTVLSRWVGGCASKTLDPCLRPRQRIDAFESGSLL